VLPLSYVGLNLWALLVAALLAAWLNPGFAPWIWLSLAGIGIVGAYILRGWQLSGIGASGLLDLAAVPVFIIWKVMLMASPRGSGEWVRTERKRS
jgi:1,2-diacylglycerol 3-beta-glucosyltransferase